MRPRKGVALGALMPDVLGVHAIRLDLVGSPNLLTITPQGQEYDFDAGLRAPQNGWRIGALAELIQPPSPLLWREVQACLHSGRQRYSN